MRWTHAVRHRFRSLLDRRRVDEELDDELHFHFENLVEQHLAAGMTRAEARHAAHREMGGLEQRREECRDARGWRWAEELWADVRLALRRLRRSPLFTAVALGSLALGIGVNTAVFTAVDALRFKPLPYPNAERLVQIDHADLPGFGVLSLHYVDWRRHSRTLEAISGYSDAGEVTLTGVGEPQKVRGLWAAPGLFSMLGASMWLGRDFIDQDHRPRAVMPVVLDHGFWQRRFGSDPSVIGRSITLNGSRHPVAGVLPPGFRFAGQPDLWGPMRLPDEEALRAADDQGNVEAIGLVRAGVGVEEVAAELMAIKRAHEDPRRHAVADRVRVLPMRERLAGDSGRLLRLLTAAVGLILLIACANVAHLMLARAMAVQKDRAVLASLGSGRFRLLRQMATEALLLSAAAGAAGLLLAAGLTRLVVALSPPETFGAMGGLVTLAVDGRVLGFTLAASLVTTFLFSLIPGLALSGPELTRSLHDDRRSALSTRSRARQALLVAEVALALVLVIGAGLLVRSFVTLLAVDPGVRIEDRLTFDVKLEGERYRDPARRSEMWRRVLDRVSGLPGVEHAGAITGLPMVGAAHRFVMFLDPHQRTEVSGFGAAVSSGYFRAAGIPLRAGRFFDARDTAEAPAAVIVSRSLARALFGEQDAVGQRRPFPGVPVATVVGVVEDVRYGLEDDALPMVYRPYSQDPLDAGTLLVHSRRSPEELAAALRAQLHALDSGLPIAEAKTMAERVADSVGARRFTMVVFGSLALLALTLASLGVYGVIAYAVAQRTQEMGIRMALGAADVQVAGLFVRQALVPGACGIALGLAGAWAFTRLLRGLLFGISATDPLTFAVAAVVLASSVIVAAALPAWQAARLPPVDALRHE